MNQHYLNSTPSIEMASVLLDAQLNLCPFNVEFLERTIPNNPFPQLGFIIDRAKKLLSRRSPEEIFNASEIIAWMIEFYFDANEELKNSLEVHSSAEKASEFIALKNCIHLFSLDAPYFSKGKDFEYFAVLAIWLAWDCLDWLSLKKENTRLVPSYISEPSLDELEVSGSERTRKNQIAGMIAMDAVAAIYYAEHLSELEDKVAVGVKEKISLQSQMALKKRHKNNHEIKALAVKLFHEKKWKSVKAAVKSIYPQLVEHGKLIEHQFSIERGPVTVYEWLLKEKNIHSGNS